MAKQVIETRFVSTGANKVAADTQKIGKEQTRLGQTSASAGREFSAQASGLGGLVGVYAAAAANVFAITAAFDALGRAAQAEQIVRGTQTLALEIGESGKSILESVQQITQSQLTLAEAAQNINIALSAGFNSDQILELSEVSLKASRALGRNLTDAFQRVVRGASKLEPELLDELGIFTRIDPAVEKYAASLNVATSSLTNFEKRQAFVNAVIEEGQKKFGNIDVSISTTQKTFEQLRVSLVELALEFGQLAANVLAPLASFFKDNIGNALLLFGGILGLVFGRALSTITGFVGSSIQQLGRFSAALADRAAFPIEKLTALQRQINQPLKGAGGGLGGIRTAAISGQDVAQAERFQRALTAQRTGAVQTASQLNKVNIAFKEQLGRMNKNTKSFENLSAAIDRNNAALKTAGFRVSAFIKLSNTLGISVKALSTAFAFLGGVLNSLFIGVAILQLAGTIFDVDLLKEIKGLFTDLSRAAEDLKAGFAGVIAASGSGNLVEQLKRVGATTDDIENVGKAINNLNKEVTGLATNFNKAGNLGIMAFAQEIGEVDRAGDFKELNQLTRENIVLEKLRVDAVDKGDKQRVVLIDNALEALKRFGQSETLIGGVANQLGLSGKQTALLLEKIIQVDKDAGTTFINLRGGIDASNKAFKDLDKTQQDAVLSFVLLSKTLEDAGLAFESGSASSETLSKKLGGAKKALKDFIEANTARKTGGFIGDPVLLSNLVAQVEKFSTLTRELKSLETIGKALTTTYGKYGQALDKAFQEGIIGIEGIAKNSQEASENQAAFLATQVGISNNAAKDLEIAKALATATEDRNATQVLLATNAERAGKAILGLAIQLPQQVEKEFRAREKLKKTLEAQLDVLNKQLEITVAQGGLQNLQAENRREINNAKELLSLDEKRLDLIKLQGKAIEDAQARDISFLQSSIRLVEIQGQISRTVLDGRAAASQSAIRTQIADQQSLISTLENNPAASSAGSLTQARERLLELERNLNQQIKDDRTEAAITDFEFQKNVLKLRLAAASQEEFNARSAIIREAALLDRENFLIDERAAIEARANLNRTDEIDRQTDILDKELELGKLKSAAQREQFDLDNKNFERQLEALKAQQTVVNKFVEATGVSPLVNALNAFTGNELDVGNILKKADVDFKALEKIQTDVEGLQNNVLLQQGAIAEAQNKNSKDALLNEKVALAGKAGILASEAQLEKDLANARFENKKKQLTEEADAAGISQTLIRAEMELLKVKHDNTIDNINARFDEEDRRIRQASDANARAADLINNARNAIADDLQSKFLNGFMQLNDAFIQGTLTIDNLKRGFNDFASALIKDIQRIFFQETIAKPAAEGLKNIFMGGEGGGSGPFSFITDLFKGASGGYVKKFAAGGMARDRVPALLEPGEFVVRRQAAKVAGAGNLSALNSTGQMGGGNVSVNVTNTGTPQEASASPPRFDGEKMVIDIVMRDLSNNGPIRKTLRAGGAG